MKFVVDAMLGKLSKWLRIMGYDTYYKNRYTRNEIEDQINENRILISRYRGHIRKYDKAIIISCDRVSDQLKELRTIVSINADHAQWFSRCLTCNNTLKEELINQAHYAVPEYIYYNNMEKIKICTLCDRYFWPGTHRDEMMKQLIEWGF